MPIIQSFRQSLFLEGAAGTGKTTAAVNYTAQLIDSGVDPESILILTPHDNLSLHYKQQFPENALLSITTFDDWVERMLEAFWSSIGEAGSRPIFLNDELARYYLSRFIAPYAKSGVFQSIRLSKSRLVGQIFDHYQQAAASGITIEEAETRAASAWTSLHSSRRKVYTVISTILHQYRTSCAENHLLDRAAQKELFFEQLLDSPLFEQHFVEHYRYLIVDSVEEMRAVDHDFIFWCMEKTEQTLIVYNRDEGCDIFRGVDPINAAQFHSICKQKEIWETYQNLSSEIIALITSVTPPKRSSKSVQHPVPNETDGWIWVSVPDIPQMISECVQAISKLIKDQHVPLGEIAIVTPYLTDNLRFSLQAGLADLEIPSLAFRPIYPLNSEPIVRAILTLLKLVIPTGARRPDRDDIAHMLHLLITNLNPVWAALLAQTTYQGQVLTLQPLNLAVKERINAEVVQRFED
jgi:superfamily I DNA/RNA helicase